MRSEDVHRVRPAVGVVGRRPERGRIGDRAFQRRRHNTGDFDHWGGHHRRVVRTPERGPAARLRRRVVDASDGNTVARAVVGGGRRLVAAAAASVAVAVLLGLGLALALLVLGHDGGRRKLGHQCRQRNDHYQRQRQQQQSKRWRFWDDFFGCLRDANAVIFCLFSLFSNESRPMQRKKAFFRRQVVCT